jgi:hypothetical protein
MKTTTTVILSIFLTLCLATISFAAGDDTPKERGVSNHQMLLDELEPYNDNVSTKNRVSEKRIDNLYMLMGELEPYGKNTRQRRSNSFKEKTRLTPKGYNNLSMLCDEIE